MATELGQWLRDVCERERLSLRQAGVRTGLSHATIRDIMNGSGATPETIKKLATAFGDGDNQRLALEDKLLVLAGSRSPRSDGELSEPMARLLDQMHQLGEPELKIMTRFAEFLMELKKADEVSQVANRNHPHRVP